MLKIVVPLGEEYYDEEKNEFVSPETFTLELEHSLASLSKWEAREELPFLTDTDKTTEQTLAYVRDMTLTPDVPDKVFECLNSENLIAINNHINAKMTATSIRELGPSRGNRGETITSEVIYYWMTSLTIPFEADKWHLNRLIMLIRVCNEKNKPSKKMPRQSAIQRQRELNAQRRAQLGSRG